MTGKEYLIDYIQNHSSEEIYMLIKRIEELTLSYTDSHQAFIDFLDDYYSLSVYPFIEGMNYMQNENGEWLIVQGENK